MRQSGIANPRRKRHERSEIHPFESWDEVRAVSGGELKDGGKTEGSVRTVPLRAIVVAALDALRPRIDTPVLFPAPRAGDIESFGTASGRPALRAAGIDHRPIKSMRHSFATWAIEAGVELSFLARIMGTSVRELEDTYFRWLTRTDEQLRAAFDAYDVGAGAISAST
jgi:integrase